MGTGLEAIMGTGLGKWERLGLEELSRDIETSLYLLDKHNEAPVPETWASRKVWADRGHELVRRLKNQEAAMAALREALG